MDETEDETLPYEDSEYEDAPEQPRMAITRTHRQDPQPCADAQQRPQTKEAGTQTRGPLPAVKLKTYKETLAALDEFARLQREAASASKRKGSRAVTTERRITHEESCRVKTEKMIKRGTKRLPWIAPPASDDVAPEGDAAEELSGDNAPSEEWFPDNQEPDADNRGTDGHSHKNRVSRHAALLALSSSVTDSKNMILAMRSRCEDSADQRLSWSIDGVALKLYLKVLDVFIFVKQWGPPYVVNV
jgi:hypothetical protein